MVTLQISAVTATDKYQEYRISEISEAMYACENIYLSCTV